MPLGANSRRLGRIGTGPYADYDFEYGGEADRGEDHPLDGELSEQTL